MSRVFEALQMASKEKKGEAVKPTVAESGDGQAGQEQKVTATESFVLGGGDGHPVSSVAWAGLERGSKSWRERTEELLFGWDLRQYKSYPLVALDNDSAAAEQYKILREQVKRLRNETGARSLSITSPIKRDGKTMVAVNLAATIALGFEEPVLLIDGDLRSPDIHHYFGVQGSPGLGDCLAAHSNGNIVNYVQETFLPGLKVLPAGKPNKLAAELLAHHKMRGLMEEIRSAFPQHQIIVDTPPVLSTPDPLVLAREVEGVIMVIRAGKTPRDHLIKAIRNLNSDKLVGIILNGAEMGAAGKHYYYYYSNNHN